MAFEFTVGMVRFDKSDVAGCGLAPAAGIVGNPNAESMAVAPA